LSRVASAIQKSLRGTDIAARIGGDEFAIILPDTDAVAGLIVATRIRRHLVQYGSTMVTVSGGLVELPRGIAEASSAQLLAAADVALYAAKKAGGNSVVQREYQPGPSTEE
jgi:diguanylate cyclase (GGDEF)-like protein